MEGPTPDQLLPLYLDDPDIERAIMVSGPHNGEILKIRTRDLTDHLYFPVPRDSGQVVVRMSDLLTDFCVPRYEVFLYELGFRGAYPSRDDLGRLRYIYKGRKII